MLSRGHEITVQSHGELEPDGTLVIRQTVSETNVAARQRKWRMREDHLGRITGTMTEAVGPIEGNVSGNQLRLKGGLAAEQLLSIDADGRTASNHVTVRKFGIVVASLDETIRKTDEVTAMPTR
jgi:hypothetical protein